MSDPVSAPEPAAVPSVPIMVGQPAPAVPPSPAASVVTPDPVSPPVAAGPPAAAVPSVTTAPAQSAALPDPVSPPVAAAPPASAATAAPPLPEEPSWFPDGSWMEAYSRLHAATDALSRVVDNFDARETATRDAYAARIDRIEAATGVRLENPSDLTMAGTNRSPQRVQDTTDYFAAFDRQVSDLAARYPDRAAAISGGPSILDEAKRIGRDAAARQAAAAEDPRLGVIGRTAATLTGGIVGSLRDPVNDMTLLIGGPGAGLAKTVAGRIAMEAGGQAVLNAAIEAVTQTQSQSWREEIGLEHGLEQAATNVAVAAGFGAFMGGGIQGAREIVRVLKATPGIPAETVRTAEVAVADLEADDVAWGPPPGLAPADAARLKAEAVRAAEDPDAPAPSVRLPRGAAPADVARLTDEANPGSALTVDGKPATFEQFRPADLDTDAATYQYKGGGNAEGVTDRLADVRRWDPVASGKVFVHEREDGRLYVADGHQRLGLARRLSDEGQTVILDGYRLREADGWTPEDVRALAAKKNMQEGSGSPLDAARVLRERPDLWDDSLPTSGPLLRRAAGLARLSDDAWGMTVNGVASEPHGALIGEMVADPSLHAGMLADLTRYDPPTERAARLLIGEMQAAGTVHETQMDMFGTYDLSRSLIGERVKVLDTAQQMLRKDRALFGTLAENREVLETAGNVIDASGSRARADSAELLIGLFERLARTRGPVSDLLTEAAHRLANGGNATAEARGFVDAVRGRIERDGLGPLLSDDGLSRLKPAATVEPGTPDALAVAESARAAAADARITDPTIRAEPVGPEAPDAAAPDTGPSLWDLVPEDGREAPDMVPAASGLAEADALDRMAEVVATDGADAAALSRAAAEGKISLAEAAALAAAREDAFGQFRLSLGDEAAAAAAQEAVAKELKATASEKRRRLLLTDAARARLKAELQGYRDPDGKPNVARAALGVLSHYGYRNGSSVRGRAEAITAMAHGRLADVMFAFRRKGAKGLAGFEDRTRVEPVVRELFGEATGDPTAKMLADSLATVFEDLRQRFNAGGGAIAKLDGWGLPQTHDRTRIKAAGRDGWKAAVAPRLDPERMLNPLTGQPVGAAGLDAALDHVYDQIVTDGWAHMTPSMRPLGRGALASQRQDHRFLIFRSADDWLTYNRDFGGGPPVKTMFNHINGMARDIAALEILGPNPGGMVEWLAQVTRSEIARAELGRQSFAKIPNAAEKGIRSIGAGADYQIRSLWSYLRGRPTVSTGAVKVIGDAKNVANAALLGSSVLVAAPTDPFIAAASRRLAGLTTKLKIGQTLATLRHGPKEDIIRAGVIWEEYTHVIESEARFAGMVVGNDWSKWLVDRSLTWSLLKPMTDARKLVEARVWQGELGGRAGQSWDQLSDKLRATMGGFGITAADWDVMRKGVDENGFVTPMAIESRTGDRRVAEQLAELVSAWGERSVPAGTPNSRALVTGPVARGTILGEFADAFLQLKSFALSFTTLQLEAIARAGTLSRHGKAAGMAAYFAPLVVGTTIGGAISMQLRNLADGKDLEDMSPDNIAFWGRAIATGGGFGLVSDFLSASENRFGQSLLDSLAGPLFGMAGDALGLTVGNALQALRGEQTNVGREAVNFAGRYTPVLASHWATRGAYRRVFLDQLQWAVDPNAHKSFRSKESYLKRERGTQYWWAPGQLLPERGPRIGRER